MGWGSMRAPGDANVASLHPVIKGPPLGLAVPTSKHVSIPQHVKHVTFRHQPLDNISGWPGTLNPHPSSFHKRGVIPSPRENVGNAPHEDVHQLILLRQFIRL